MKKIATMLLCFAFVLVGCEDKQTVYEVENTNVRFAGMKGGITIVTDNKTGCRYIREEYGSGNSLSISLSPLYKANGNMDCD